MMLYFHASRETKRLKIEVLAKQNKSLSMTPLSYSKKSNPYFFKNSKNCRYFLVFFRSIILIIFVQKINASIPTAFSQFWLVTLQESETVMEGRQGLYYFLCIFKP